MVSEQCEQFLVKKVFFWWNPSLVPYLEKFYSHADVYMNVYKSEDKEK